MNKERMLALADRIEKVNRLNMLNYFTTKSRVQATRLYSVLDEQNNFCGTACCIAGEAALMAFESGYCNNVLAYADEVAPKFLNLTTSECFYLFGGVWTEKGLHKTDAKLAAKAIRKMVKNEP